MTNVRKRLLVLALGCGVLAAGACGSSSHQATVTPSTNAPASSTTTGASASAPAAAPTTTSTIPEVPTTSLPCEPLPIPATPVTSPATSQSVLLTSVKESGAGCLDQVAFEFTGKGTDPPGYTVTYGSPPFAQDGSGAPVTVAGNAFIVVKMKPAYGYDFENAKATYTGPKSIAVTGARHVQSIVETGDFEGQLTWVIGLKEKRAFTVQATGTPRHELVIVVG